MKTNKLPIVITGVSHGKYMIHRKFCTSFTSTTSYACAQGEMEEIWQNLK